MRDDRRVEIIEKMLALDPSGEKPLSEGEISKDMYYGVQVSAKEKKEVFRGDLRSLEIAGLITFENWSNILPIMPPGPLVIILRMYGVALSTDDNVAMIASHLGVCND